MILIHAPSPTGAEESAGPKDAVAPVSMAKTCAESYSQSATQEFNKRCIELAGPLAAMRGGTVVLRMDDGSRKVFDNKNGDGAAEGGFGYGLADFHPSTHVFVVCDYGADNGHCTAIHGQTSRQQDFGSAVPRFSPDGNWAFIVKDAGEGTNSIFAILDVRGKKPLKVWTTKASKAPLLVKARFVAWDGDKKIRLAGPSRKPVFLVQAADGTWSVNGTPAN